MVLKAVTATVPCCPNCSVTVGWNAFAALEFLSSSGRRGRPRKHGAQQQRCAHPLRVRARLSDQLASKTNKLGEAVERRARDLRNRGQGLLHQVGLLSSENRRRAGTAGTENQSNRSEIESESGSPRLGDQLV